jgi:anti-sigma-K factor RskA
MSPGERRNLLGVYALNDVNDEERAAVDELLLEDQDARAELHALQFGAAWLARSDLRPAEHVWSKIRAEVDSDLEADRVAVADDRVVPLAPRRARRTRWIVAAAVAAVVALGVLVPATLLRSDSGGTPVAQAARAASHDPSARQVKLRSSDGSIAAHLAVFSNGDGYVVTAQLPKLSAGQTYQLWAMNGAVGTSAGVLGRDPGVQRVRGGQHRAGTYAITNEPAGGSPRPTGPVLASTEFA